MLTHPTSSGCSDLERFFPGDSEMAGRMRTLDWSSTDFGPPENWPENLRVAVSICLPCRLPILLWWGPKLNILYNDAYLAWLTKAKHPRALGRPGIECWPEIWSVIGPMMQSVLATGKATWSENMELYFARRLPKEEVYITYTYAPILAGDAQTVDGIFNPCTETTEQVVGARRLETLRKLGIRSPETRTVEAACRQAAVVLSENPRDLPFAAIYLVDATGTEATISAAVIPEGDDLLPRSVSLSADDSLCPWPLASVLRTKRSLEIEDLGSLGVRIPGKPWPEPVKKAVVLPIYAAPATLAGVFVAGVGPRRPWNAAYSTFFELVGGHIGSAISDVKAYEDQRRRAEALAEIDRAKTTFFSNVSHEFRTPLTLMLGPIEDMLERGNSITIQRDELQLVHRNGLRLLKLVNALLDFSRIEAGRLQSFCEPVDLPAFTAELASIFRAAIEKAGLRLVVNCPAFAEPVYVDRSMWEKIVLNLLSNAFKFTFEGAVAVSLVKTGGFAELSVSDTGTGIAKNELPRLFERFHRIAGARGRTYEGSGIGLALVQELVKLNGGTVRVESALGCGSRFMVSVPLGTAHLSAARIGPKQPSTAVAPRAYVEEALRWQSDVQPVTGDLLATTKAPSGERAQVLFADDNGDLRDYVRRLLGAAYDVSLVADGEAALMAARQRPPDLLLADVMMPRLDGFGLLKEWRADPRLCSIPVILLSARAGEESIIEGFAAGVTDYLVKPFSASELMARVGTCLEIARENRAVLAREHELRKSAQGSEARTREELVAETSSMNRFHELGTRLLTKTELQPILEEVLTATMALQSARLGSIQFYNRATRSLAIVTQKGFKPDFLAHFWDCRDETTICGRVLAQRKRVIVEDVRSDAGFAPHRAAAEAAGYRAVLSTPLLSRNGEPLGIISTYFPEPHRPSDRELRFTDLYARLAAELIGRQRSEEALRASEARFRSYFELGLIGMAVTSPAKGILEVNDELCRILGYPRHEMFQKTWAEMTHPDDLAADVHQFNRVMAGEIEGYSLDKRWIRKDGRVIHSIMSAKCLRRADGSVDYFVGLVLDTTERKRAEERLQRSEAYLAEGQRISHTGSWAVKLPSEEIFWSEEVFRIYGLDPDTTNLSQRMAFQLIHPDDRALVQEAFRRAVREKTDYDVEHRAFLSDTSKKYLRALGHPVLNESGEVIEYVGTVADITERKQAEEALHKARAELLHVTRVTTMGELAASIAHEINQPLGAIANNANVCFRLAAASGNQDDMREALTDIVNDSNRASAIIARIRAMTKRALPEKTSLQFRDVIAEVLALSHHQLAEHRIEVRTELPEDLPQVSGDRVQLQQVLLNLVMNGAEAMSAIADPHRILTISGRRSEWNGEPGILIAVTDIGCGFSAEDPERLFEGFYTTKPNGLGMGLRISRSIVEAHGGSLWAQANDEAGATFLFFLPVAISPIL
jgi:PAS domain S-box-containing protein